MAFRPNFTKICRFTVFALVIQAVAQWPGHGRVYNRDYRPRFCDHGIFIDGGLVVRVLGYRSGGPGSISGTTRKI
jgi:hypothetical protein